MRPEAPASAPPLCVPGSPLLPRLTATASGLGLGSWSFLSSSPLVPFLQSEWCGEPPREPPGEDEDDDAETGAPCGGKGVQAALGTLKPALSPGDNEDEEEVEDTEDEPLSLRESPLEPLE